MTPRLAWDGLTPGQSRIGRRCSTPRASRTCSKVISTERTHSSPVPLDAATRAGVLPFVPVLLAERGIVAIERDDWAEAGAFAEQALAIMQDGPVRRVLDECPRVRLGGTSGVASG